MRFDSTFKKVEFAYEKNDGSRVNVQTLEEIEFPAYYYNRAASDEQPSNQQDNIVLQNKTANKETIPSSNLEPDKSPTEGHEVIKENQKK